MMIMRQMHKWVQRSSDSDPDFKAEMARATAQQIAGGMAWDNNELRYCFDPNISSSSKDAFLVAIEQYKAALPGCIKFTNVGATNRNCNNYPRQAAIKVRSSDSGCYVNGYLG